MSESLSERVSVQFTLEEFERLELEALSAGRTLSGEIRWQMRKLWSGKTRPVKVVNSDVGFETGSIGETFRVPTSVVPRTGDVVIGGEVIKKPEFCNRTREPIFPVEGLIALEMCCPCALCKYKREHEE